MTRIKRDWMRTEWTLLPFVRTMVRLELSDMLKRDYAEFLKRWSNGA